MLTAHVCMLRLPICMLPLPVFLYADNECCSNFCDSNLCKSSQSVYGTYLGVGGVEGGGWMLIGTTLLHELPARIS